MWAFQGHLTRLALVFTLQTGDSLLAHVSLHAEPLHQAVVWENSSSSPSPIHQPSSPLLLVPHVAVLLTHMCCAHLPLITHAFDKHSARPPGATPQTIPSHPATTASLHVCHRLRA
jgi:hypothetical protein